MSLPCPNPECGSADTAALDTRTRMDEQGVPYVWRRRKCKKCGKRFSTVENRATDLEQEQAA